MSAPVASLIIRTLNEASGLDAVLSAVRAQERVGTFEVLVLDSGSTDGTLDVVARHDATLHTIARADFTFGRALNLGARLARAPICVHLSGHCLPTSRQWLRSLLEPLADPQVIATYGRQRPVPGVNPYEAIEMERAFPSGLQTARQRRYFSNANCAVRRTTLLERPFDETITSMEDSLWLTGAASERVVYVPAAEVLHSHPLRPSYWYARYWRDGVAYRYLALRHGVDLLPERSLRPGHRVVGLASELLAVTRELVVRGYWRHAAAFPLFCVLREVALRRGLRHGRRIYRESRRCGTTPTTQIRSAEPSP
jgi:rhamnosyltransferase